MNGRTRGASGKQCSKNGPYHYSDALAIESIPTYVAGYPKHLVFLPRMKIEAVDGSNITDTFKSFVDEYSGKDDDGNVDHTGLLNGKTGYDVCEKRAFRRAKRKLGWDKLNIHDFFKNDDF